MSDEFSPADPLVGFRQFLQGLVGPQAHFRTRHALAEAMGLSDPVISRAMRAGGYSVDIEPCLRLAQAIGSNPLDVLRIAGKGKIADLLGAIFGPARPLDALTTLDVIWLGLTPAEKDALIRSHTAIRAAVHRVSQTAADRLVGLKSTADAPEIPVFRSQRSGTKAFSSADDPTHATARQAAQNSEVAIREKHRGKLQALGRAASAGQGKARRPTAPRSGARNRKLVG